MTSATSRDQAGGVDQGRGCWAACRGRRGRVGRHVGRLAGTGDSSSQGTAGSIEGAGQSRPGAGDSTVRWCGRLASRDLERVRRVTGLGRGSSFVGEEGWARRVGRGPELAGQKGKTVASGLPACILPPTALAPANRCNEAGEKPRKPVRRRSSGPGGRRGALRPAQQSRQSEDEFEDEFICRATSTHHRWAREMDAALVLPDLLLSPGVSPGVSPASIRSTRPRPASSKLHHVSGPQGN